MPRPLRIDYPNALHHITLKAQRGETRFRCRACRSAVFYILEDAASRFETQLHAYSVMDTHLHLYATSPDARLPRTMQYVASAITRCINGHHNEDGHVFKGRYFNRTVESDAYRNHLLSYIHLNPTKAGLARQLGDPEWTSHAYFTGELSPPGWLHPGRLLDGFGGVDAYLSYLHDAETGIIEPPVGFEESVLLHPRCSDTYTATTHVAVEVDPSSLLAAFERRHGPVRRGGKRGMPQLLRDRAMAWMLRHGATQRQIAAEFGVGQPAVSRAIRRVRPR